MRRILAGAAALVAVLAACAGCGGGAGGRRDADPHRGTEASRRALCARAGFAGGSSAADGVFFAAIPRACVGGRGATCTVGDGTGPISRVVVDRGIVAGCVAFNQFVGSGLSQVPGYVTGECFGTATVAAPPAVPARVRRAPRRCLPEGGRSPEAGPPAAPLERGLPRTATIEAHAADPWPRAPESGAVGGRSLRPPPWAVLTWTTRDGATCLAPGQLVGPSTPGRADQLPGVRPSGRGLTRELVGSLRYDSRSGTGSSSTGWGASRSTRSRRARRAAIRPAARACS